MTWGFGKELLMKLFYQYMIIFFSLPQTQVIFDHYKSGLWLVVDEDDNGKFRPERVNKK